MPGPTAPTYYEHSKGILMGRYDSFLKWLTPDHWLVDTGEVEAPVGFVALVEITTEIQDEYKDHLGHWRKVLAAEIPEVGWYVVRSDNNGIVWGMTYGTGTMAEEGARADFKSASDTYTDWLERTVFYGD